MIPKNWDDITIEQYEAIQKTISEEPKTDEGLERLLIKRISLLTNKEPDWVEDNLTIQDLHKMSDLLKTPLPTKLVKSFRLNGKLYTVDIDPTKYNAGRYMSVMNQIKDKRVDNTHKLLFQVCRRITWYGKTIEPDLNTIGEDIESFKQLPLKIANPIKVFFCSLSESLMQDTLLYLTDQAKKAKENLEEEIDYLNASVG